MNVLSLLLLVALAVAIVIAYRVGVARGARSLRNGAALGASTSDPAAVAAGESRDAGRQAHAVVNAGNASAELATAASDSVADTMVRGPAADAIPAGSHVSLPADAAALLAQAEAFAGERHALYRALADARGETARYRQFVIDLENDAPPPLLDSPAAPDDLKLIVGIGPVLERMLQQLGVSRYRQIARWSEREIDEFDARLPEFPGRIRRDEWVTQARALHQSKYGETLPSRDRS